MPTAWILVRLIGCLPYWLTIHTVHFIDSWTITGFLLHSSRGMWGRDSRCHMTSGTRGCDWLMILRKWLRWFMFITQNTQFFCNYTLHNQISSIPRRFGTNWVINSRRGRKSLGPIKWNWSTKYRKWVRLKLNCSVRASRSMSVIWL